MNPYNDGLTAWQHLDLWEAELAEPEDEGLSPARGLVYGILISLALWAGIIGIAWIVVSIIHQDPCGIDLYHTPALGNVVSC